MNNRAQAEAYAAADFAEPNALLSNSLLHHLDDPDVLWQTIQHCARPGAALCLMDLARPASATAVDTLIAAYAADAPDVLRRDFRNSLCAAYSPTEVAAQLRHTGLRGCVVRTVSDRHLAVIGRCRFRKNAPAGMFC